MPLFDGVENIYVIDTSGLIMIESTFPPNDITFEALWEEIDYLISINSFRTIDYVETEINSYIGKHHFLLDWIAHRKKVFVYETTTECYIAAMPIVNAEYSTGFFDAKKQAEGKEEADPYLIAYCQIHGFTLITNENKNKPNKIPAVAKRYGVRCIDGYDFLRERGLKLERKR